MQQIGHCWLKPKGQPPTDEYVKSDFGELSRVTKPREPTCGGREQVRSQSGKHRSVKGKHQPQASQRRNR